MSDFAPQSGAPTNDPPLAYETLGSSPVRLAYRRRSGDDARPGLVWLGGFRSDMGSTKAERLDQWARDQNRACLRFDYSGHGESEGEFRSGTIGRWTSESLDAIRQLTRGPQILVGSSMGGWIALLVGLALAKAQEPRLAGIVLIAPAVDFTESLLWAQMPEDARLQLRTEGVWMRTSAYSSEPYPVTRELIDEGRNHLLLGDAVSVGCPIHILQGMRDPDVPWRHALALVERLADDPVTLCFIKDGDHRLSRDADIARLIDAVASIA